MPTESRSRRRNRPCRPALYLSVVGTFLAAMPAPTLGQGVIITPIGSYSDRALTATLLPSGGLFVSGTYQGPASEDHAAATYPLAPIIGAPTVKTTYYNPQNSSGNVDYASSSVLVGNDVVTAGVAATYDGSLGYVSNFAITWWNSAGAYRKVETVFNPNKKGKPTTKSKAYEILRAPDGSIVAVGVDENGGTRLALARYNSATGALLAKKLNTVDFTPRGATLQGNFVLAVGKSLSDNQMAVVRLDLNGNVDTAWGTGGKVVLPLGSDSQAEAATIDGAGRIVIAGSAVFGDREAVVVRLNADGSPDLTFNQVGYVSTDLGGTEDVYTAVNLRANGLIVATGYTSYFDSGRQYGRFAASQYLGDGALDTANFGVGGIALIPINDSAICNDSRIQADGRIVLVGEVRTVVQVTPRVTNLDFGAVQLAVNGRP
jgi:uncharacterized delta-60 repeat protein